MPQVASVATPFRRSPLSHQNFKSQGDNLARLHVALEGIGTRLCSIAEEESLPMWLAYELRGIGSVLDCLGTMAGSASEDAEEWQMWAKEGEGRS